MLIMKILTTLVLDVALILSDSFAPSVFFSMALTSEPSAGGTT